MQLLSDDLRITIEYDIMNSKSDGNEMLSSLNLADSNLRFQIAQNSHFSVR